jgi:hypothetical protein
MRKICVGCIHKEVCEKWEKGIMQLTGLAPSNDEIPCKTFAARSTPIQSCTAISGSSYASNPTIGARSAPAPAGEVVEIESDKKYPTCPKCGRGMSVTKGECFVCRKCLFRCTMDYLNGFWDGRRLLAPAPVVDKVIECDVYTTCYKDVHHRCTRWDKKLCKPTTPATNNSTKNKESL